MGSERKSEAPEGPAFETYAAASHVNGTGKRSVQFPPPAPSESPPNTRQFFLRDKRQRVDVDTASGFYPQSKNAKGHRCDRPNPAPAVGNGGR
jgi:hypothetical protein